MGNFKFAAAEYSFPVWGSLAFEMAKHAGFDGIEITDGGGYLQPHPDNNGFVEYERLGLDLQRQDSFPLNDPYVQDYYMNASAKSGVEIMGIFLYMLENQGFIKNTPDSAQGRHCFETIENAIKAASDMNINQVTIPVNGLFGVFQHEYAFQKVEYAVREAEDRGVDILILSDGSCAWQKEMTDRSGGRAKLSFRTLDPVICASGTPADMIETLGKEYISQIRAKDLKADKYGFVTAQTGQNALLGSGDSGFEEIAASVLKSGIKGWIVSETPYYSSDFTEIGEDYMLAAAKDVNTLNSLFNGK